MLKLAGHVKKHYKLCCIIFEAFKDRKGVNATFEGFLSEIEKGTVSIAKANPGWTPQQLQDEQSILRGDMLEIFAEIFFGAFANDPAVGITGYTPVPLPEDYGVDGVGTNAAGTKCAVQVKYRGSPTDLVTYAEIARTFTSAVLQMGLPLYLGDDNIFIFTSAYDVTVACKTVMGSKIHILNRGVISGRVDNNVNFWDYAFNEIKNTLL